MGEIQFGLTPPLTERLHDLGHKCRASTSKIHDWTSHEWGKWVMGFGGFAHSDQVDATGMSPLAHAIEQSYWSVRASLAANGSAPSSVDQIDVDVVKLRTFESKGS